MPTAYGAGFNDILNVGFGGGAGTNVTTNAMYQQQIQAAYIGLATSPSWEALDSLRSVIEPHRKAQKNLKRFSEESFDKMTKTPLIKDVMSGAVKLDKEGIKNRVGEYLALI